jgi:hypothetical protein
MCTLHTVEEKPEIRRLAVHPLQAVTFQEMRSAGTNGLNPAGKATSYALYDVENSKLIPK